MPKTSCQNFSKETEFKNCTGGQGPRAGRLVHEVFTMGLGMFFSAQSRKTSNCARAVDPSMPMCVWHPPILHRRPERRLVEASRGAYSVARRNPRQQRRNREPG